MTEKEQNQLAFYKRFYHLVWERKLMSNSAVYDIERRAEQESGFDLSGKEVEKVGDDA